MSRLMTLIELAEAFRSTPADVSDLLNRRGVTGIFLGGRFMYDYASTVDRLTGSDRYHLIKAPEGMLIVHIDEDLNSYSFSQCQAICYQDNGIENGLPNFHRSFMSEQGSCYETAATGEGMVICDDYPEGRPLSQWVQAKGLTYVE